MKIKVIDIMNKIHNKEKVPKKIMYDFKTYFYDERTQDYTDYDRTYGLFSDLLDKQCGIFSCLNDEVEIIEEEKKIPEKINNGYTKQSIEDMKEARFNSNDMAKICNTIGWLMQNRNDLSNKIDEIIDYLKSKGE